MLQAMLKSDKGMSTMLSETQLWTILESVRGRTQVDLKLDRWPAAKRESLARFIRRIPARRPYQLSRNSEVLLSEWLLAETVSEYTAFCKNQKHSQLVRTTNNTCTARLKSSAGAIIVDQIKQMERLRTSTTSGTTSTFERTSSPILQLAAGKYSIPPEAIMAGKQKAHLGHLH